LSGKIGSKLDQEMLMRKCKIFVLAFLSIAMYMFLSCGDGNGSGEGILYWSSNNTHAIEFADYLVTQWNEANPDLIPIRFQPVPEGRSSEEIILAAVVGKTTPDIYSNIWQGDVEAYAQAGVLIPFDTLDGFKEFIYERCDSSVIEEIRSQDGHIYQIPWKINPIMLIYNENIIAELGLENPPRTYKEFFNACELYTKDNNGDGYVDQWFGYSEVLVTWWQRFFDFYPLYLAASGGAPLIKNNKAVFNNKYALQVLYFLRTLYEKKYFAQERLSAKMDVFLSEVIATRFVGPWEIIHAEKFKPEGFEYDYTTMPVPDDFSGPAYTYGDPKNIVIFNTCHDPQLAWEFIKTMITKESDLKLLELTTQVPRRKNIDKESPFIEYFEANPKMRAFAKQSNYVRGTDSSPVLKEIFDIISQEYEACVIFTVKSPEEALRDAEHAVNLLFLE
jgi:multiple sugar transport system substrate-binding protein